MKLTIRKGKKEDLPQVFNLIRELAIYEKAAEEVETNVEMLEEDGFGNNPVFGFHVADSGSRIIGLAFYYFRYSTWKGKILYLEDLIVTEDNRRRGIGRLLMDAVISEANRTNCKGVQWQVLDWNTPAIRFYERYSPVQDAEWINCRLTSSQLEYHNSIS